MIKQAFWSIQEVQEEVNGFLFLDAIKYLERRVATGNTGYIFSVNLENICVAAES